MSGASQNVSAAAPSGIHPPTLAFTCEPVPYALVTPAERIRAMPAAGIRNGRVDSNRPGMQSSLGVENPRLRRLFSQPTQLLETHGARGAHQRLETGGQLQPWHFESAPMLVTDRPA